MSYSIYIGRNCTADGVAYLSGYGDEPSSHWIELCPRQHYPVGSTVQVGVTPEAELPGLLSEIPQIGTTARNVRVNYSYYKGTPAPLTNGGLNEFGVAVRDVWSPSRPELIALTPRDQTGPNYSDLARLVLERATTAREGVTLIGELIGQYGHTSYGGNSHMIADPNEAWIIIEFAGGQGIWVAEKLGADDVRVSRPGYIGEVPFHGETQARFLHSPNFFEVAIEQGWFDPSASKCFDVNAVYGDGKGRWPGVSYIEEKMHALGREGAIKIEDIMSALRDTKITGDSAGYGQIIPLVETEYNQLRSFWHAHIGAIAAPFIPIYLGVEEVPEEFRSHRYLTDFEPSRLMEASFAIGTEGSSAISQGVESTRSATYVFKRLQYLIFQHHELFLPEITSIWTALERSLIKSHEDFRQIAGVLLGSNNEALATRTLTYFCDTELIKALDMAEKLAQSLEIRTRALFGINTGSVPKSPTKIW